MLLALLFSAGCSKIQLAGVSATRYQNVTGNYSGIVVRGAMTVEMSPEYDMVEISSDSNVLPYIEVRIVDNSLVIGYKEDARFSSGNFDTCIRLPYSASVESVSISDMSSFRCAGDVSLSSRLRLEAQDMSSFEFGRVTSPSFILTLRDASSFRASDVDFQESSLNFSDASSAMMSGRIERCDAVLSDASSLSSAPGDPDRMLTIGSFSCTLSDASYAGFHSDGVITGTLMDASTICYSGSAVCGSVNRFDGAQIIRK